MLINERMLRGEAVRDEAEAGRAWIVRPVRLSVKTSMKRVGAKACPGNAAVGGVSDEAEVVAGDTHLLGGFLPGAGQGHGRVLGRGRDRR